MDWTSFGLCLSTGSRIVSAKQRAAERQQTEREERMEALINAAQPGSDGGDREVQAAGMWEVGGSKRFVLLACWTKTPRESVVRGYTWIPHSSVTSWPWCCFALFSTRLHTRCVLEEEAEHSVHQTLWTYSDSFLVYVFLPWVNMLNS